MVLIGGGLAAAVVIGIGGAVVWGSDDPSTGSAVFEVEEPGSRTPGTVVQDFIAAFAAGDVAGAAATTDAEQPARAALGRSRIAMSTAAYTARLGAIPAIGAEVTATTIPADVTWTLPGGAPWTYRTAFEVKRDGKQWRVHWTPAALHPALVEGQALKFEPVSSQGSVLDRDGKPLPEDTGDYAKAVLPGVRGEVGGTGGKPGWKVLVVDAADAPVATVQEKQAVVTQSVTVTLDKAVQDAAQAAVDGVPQEAAIVAIDTGTGEILAVAQNAAATATGPVALGYLHEPGSTFKMVTAAAAIEGGAVTVDTTVECPGEAVVGTRKIPNEGKFDLGAVPLRQAFAQSCNTTFGKLAGEMSDSALTTTARQFGIGADYDVAGISTNTGKVPPAVDVAERVENGIGQGKVQTTPFGMALAAATVATGRTPTPQLIREIPTKVNTAPTALPADAAQALRPMMREVVTGGTATALGGFGAVSGKTGTAQFGDGTHAHGWFVGYRGTMAFAVLVVDGGSSKAAVGVTATFLGPL